MNRKILSSTETGMKFILTFSPMAFIGRFFGVSTPIVKPRHDPFKIERFTVVSLCDKFSRLLVHDVHIEDFLCPRSWCETDYSLPTPSHMFPWVDCIRTMKTRGAVAADLSHFRLRRGFLVEGTDTCLIPLTLRFQYISNATLLKNCM